MTFPRAIRVLLLVTCGLWSAPALAQTGGGAARQPARTPSRTAAAPRRDMPEADADPRQPSVAPRNPSERAVPTRQAQSNGRAAASAAGAPIVMAPFQLSESQQRLLEQILAKWEQQSEKVKTFTCRFSRWEYDPTWGPEKLDYRTSDATGYIMYSAPIGASSGSKR